MDLPAHDDFLQTSYFRHRWRSARCKLQKNAGQGVGAPAMVVSSRALVESPVVPSRVSSLVCVGVGDFSLEQLVGFWTRRFAMTQLGTPISIIPRQLPPLRAIQVSYGGVSLFIGAAGVGELRTLASATPAARHSSYRWGEAGARILSEKWAGGMHTASASVPYELSISTFTFCHTISSGSLSCEILRAPIVVLQIPTVDPDAGFARSAVCNLAMMWMFIQRAQAWHLRWTFLDPDQDVIHSTTELLSPSKSVKQKSRTSNPHNIRASS